MELSGRLVRSVLVGVAAAGVVAVLSAQAFTAPVGAGIAGTETGAARHAAAGAAAPVVTTAATAVAAAPQETTYDKLFDDPGFLAREAGFSDPEKVGRRIWLYATAGNDRFHTYTFQQRLGVFIDWFRVLNTDQRGERFSTWGLINDPGCCTPGDPGCPAQSKEETYGFDYCIGDDELLSFVGREGYRDPACDLYDAELTEYGALAPPPGHGDQRQSPCDLDFGTSSGVMGLRKFPNPRFDPDRWRQLNADFGRGLGTWEGYQRVIEDGSVEPPFYIGMACGACHIAFDPENPPDDVNNPQWENLTGTVGNQYARFSEIMASGMGADTLEWQIFSHARPGTVDTSAVPNDGVNNPGTMNAIINFGRRPLYDHDVVKWRPVQQCTTDDEETCWCEPGKPGKCWEKGLATEPVPNVLKGGEDSIGVLEAIQRVYINIGSCSEQAWVNHLLDLRQADPEQRLFRQTPFDIGQARRDCANFRAIEDRLVDIGLFLLTGRPHELYRARGLNNRDQLVAQLNREFGANAVQRGRQIFVDNCARCHASPDDVRTLTGSQPLDPVASRDFWAEDPDNPGLRLDWMGNDQLTPVTEVGTYSNRALHSNHMEGHVWQEYGSETLRAKPALDPPADPPTFLPELESRRDGGRGYYRNISLLSLWAHAPLMHNNAIGPELCGPAISNDWAADPSRNLYRSPYIATDADGNLLFDDNGNPLPHDNPPACWEFDASVEGRFELYKESMRLLLNPDQRIPKITLVAEDIHLPIGPGGLIRNNEEETSLEIVIPAGDAGGLSGQPRPQATDRQPCAGEHRRWRAARAPGARLGGLRRDRRRRRAGRGAPADHQRAADHRRAVRPGARQPFDRRAKGPPPHDPAPLHARALFDRECRPHLRRGSLNRREERSDRVPRHPLRRSKCARTASSDSCLAVPRAEPRVAPRAPSRVAPGYARPRLRWPPRWPAAAARPTSRSPKRESPSTSPGSTTTCRSRAPISTP